MAVIEINHPLAKEKLTLLRDVKTHPDQFKRYLEELSFLIFYEASKNLPTKTVSIETPLREMETDIIKNRVILITVLRAGIGMTRLIREFNRNTSVGFVGLKRDEQTLKPITYYINLPTIKDDAEVFIVDPMLATGGSIIKTLEILEGYNIHARGILSIISAPEGIEAVTNRYPGLDIYTCSIDEKLNENGFIVPGLGDAGDRLFGTEE